MNVVIFALLGGLVGGSLAMSGAGGGFWLGAAVGALAAWVAELRKRVAALERRTSEATSAAPERRRIPAAPAPEPSAADPWQPGALEPAAGATRSVDPGPAQAQRSPPARASQAADPEPSLLDRGLALGKDWLTTGNVPVKVGVVLSVFGAAFLVKEAIDRNWMVLPLELRLAAVALFGVALSAFGWRLRTSHRVYALSVQGGGIAVLYLTIYASFALYGLLPAAAAFALLLGLTAAGGALAVLQDARALAVLGIVGGFMAPVLTSTGAGNHVALFSYYAILDLAIFGIAWFKAWRLLNLLGFAFTFGIGSLWGYGGYRPELFASTEPFLVLFVLLYTLIPVLFALRGRPELKGFVDGTLVFGTPIIGFALQTRLLGDNELGLAASALTLAAWYVGLATFLQRRGAASLRVLTEALFGLSIVFLTIAVPLALDARWTAAAWALQGAALIWLGVRQRRPLALAAGVLLELGAGFAYWQHHAAVLAADAGLGRALGAALIGLAGAFSSFWLDRAESPRARAAAPAALGWATLWWVAAGVLEIDRLLTSGHLDALHVFIAATLVAVTFTAPRLAWRRLDYVGLLGVGFIVLGGTAAFVVQRHPLGGFGAAGWLALFGAHYFFLHRREAQLPARWRVAAHTAAYWMAGFLLAWEAHWQVDRVADGAWPIAAALAAAGAFVLVTLTTIERLRWPLAAHRSTYSIGACGAALAALVTAVVAANIATPGDPRPLPYVPLANPLELASVLAVLVAVHWWRRLPAAAVLVRPQAAAVGAAAIGLALLTMSVARAVHHWAGVPFELERLAGSTVLQATLSIAWGSAALAGMLIGARAVRRHLWLAGAALMAAVVVKLFVVELGNAGTVGRVVSFLGVGLLLLVVGYFAPVPPRHAAEARGA